MSLTARSPQPGALYLLNFVSMWECFSYYGMRVLLVLFMVQELGYSDGRAFVVYAFYTTLVEFGGILGGVSADKALGFRRSITLGGITITLGHICMAFSQSQQTLFFGLGLIVLGTSLFRANLAAYVGTFYEENDPRRDAGYTLYYAGMNIGGFLAAITCGIVGEVYGWHAGFGLAAIGMVLGNIVLYFGRGILVNSVEQQVMKGNAMGVGAIVLVLGAPFVALGLYYADVFAQLFPLAMGGIAFYIFRQISMMTPQETQSFLRLGLFVGFLILFYACEEQLGSSLVLFSERHVDRMSVFGEIPAASLVMFNPLTILLAGPGVSWILRRYPLEPLAKISVSFILLGAAFYLLYSAGVLVSNQGAISLGVVVGSICLLSFGEIFIGPTIFSMASGMAPRALQGLVMGIVTLGFALANHLSGVLSHMMVVDGVDDSIAVYTQGFGVIAIASCVIGVIVLVINFRRKVWA